MHGVVRHARHPVEAHVPARPGEAVRARSSTTRSTRSPSTRPRSGGTSRAATLDFMDGIIHSPTQYVLSCGRFVDRGAVHEPLRLDEGLLPEHPRPAARTTCARPTTSSATTAASPTCTRDAARPAAVRQVARLDAGPAPRRKPALAAVRAERPHVIVDVFMPFSQAPTFLDWYRQRVRPLPALVRALPPCAALRVAVARVHRRAAETELFLDLAIYGMKQTDRSNCHAPRWRRSCASSAGIKTLISHNYYSEDDFWQIWNKPNYDTVKAPHRSGQRVPRPVREDLPSSARVGVICLATRPSP